MQFENPNSAALHGILMAIAFAVFLPAAAFASRYFKEQLDRTWIRIYISLLSIGTAMIAYATYLVYPLADYSFSAVNKHVWLGFLVLALIVLQIGLGLSCRFDHDPDLKEEETIRDTLHGSFGYILLVCGWVAVLDGLWKVSVSQFVSRDTPITIMLAWIVALFILFAICEYYIGRTSRYSKGNIFAACSQFGAKKLFSISGKHRMGIIDANIVAPSNTVMGGIFTTPRTKEGMLSPFMYRPAWDTGLKKSKPIESIVPTEQFVKKNEPKHQATENALERITDQENIPRSRSSSIRNNCPITLAPENDTVKSRAPSRSRSITTSILSTTRGRKDSVLERLAEKLTKEDPVVNK
jgi:cytochrome b561